MRRTHVVLAFAAASAALSAQQPAPTLRASAEQVVVDVVVTDATGAQADVRAADRGHARTLLPAFRRWRRHGWADRARYGSRSPIPLV